MKIIIFGAGNMAAGIGLRALSGGHAVGLVDTDAAKAEQLAGSLQRRTPNGQARAAAPLDVGEADLVVLALPYPAGVHVAATYEDDLAGKPVVDISNPVDFQTMDSLLVPPGTSAAEQIAEAAPHAHVVKAFNTTFAATLHDGQVAGQPLDVFIAGDDPAAKKTVAELASSGGLRPIDAGPLRRARELEAMQLLHMGLQNTIGAHWSSAIKILP